MYLVWESPQGPVVHAIERAVTIVGSDPVSDLCIRHKSIAARHALVQLADGRVTITDLGSGRTKINGAALVPELPSTLEPGDFVSLGAVLLGFHRIPPPSSRPSRPPQHTRRPSQAVPSHVRRAPARPAAPAVTPSTWKWAAIGLGILLVGCLGALIAVLAMGRGGKPAPDAGKAAVPSVPAKEEAASPPEPAPADEPEPRAPEPPPARETPKPEAPPKEDKVVEGLPPATYATLESCPDLLEARDVFSPIRILHWDKGAVKAVGSDGRTYRFRVSDVERITDREDLRRRASQRIARQGIEDARGCAELARWCFRRHVRTPLEPFLKRVLALRPDDPLKELAKALQGTD